MNKMMSCFYLSFKKNLKKFFKLYLKLTTSNEKHC